MKRVFPLHFTLCFRMRHHVSQVIHQMPVPAGHPPSGKHQYPLLVDPFNLIKSKHFRSVVCKREYTTIKVQRYHVLSSRRVRLTGEPAELRPVQLFSALLYERQLSSSFFSSYLLICCVYNTKAMIPVGQLVLWRRKTRRRETT